MMSSPRQSWLRSSVLVLSLAAGCTQSAPPAPTPPPRYEFFIFVCTDPAMRAAVELPLGNMIAELAVPTEKVHLIVCHPTRHEPLGAITVPAVDGAERLDDPSIAEVTDRWDEFFTGESEGDSSLQLNLPAVSTTIAELRQTSLPPRIILCGDQLYDDPRHPGWSMKGGVRISDGALRPNSSGPRSPFVEGVVPFPPESLLVHLAPQVDGCLDDLHRAKTLRFNRAFVQMNGALWVRSTKDPGTAFRFAEPFNTEQVVLCDEPAGLVGASFVTLDNGAPRGPVEQILERNDPPKGKAKSSPPATITPATPVEPRKETLLKPVVKQRIVANNSLIPKPRPTVDTTLAPRQPRVAPPRGPLKNVVFAIDVSGSYANRDGSLTAAWDQQTAAVQQQIHALPFTQFALLGLGGRGSEGQRPRLEAHPYWYINPTWSSATPAARAEACRTLAEWECGGMTPTLYALQTAVRYPEVDTVVLISDGLPSSPQSEVLAFAQQQRVVINTLFVEVINDREACDYEMPAREFMRQLAEVTGGSASVLPVSN